MRSVSNQTSKLSQWWFTLFVGTVVVLGTGIVMLPRISHIQELVNQKSQLTDKLNKLSDKETKLNSIDSENVLEQLKTAMLALPDRKPYYEVFANVQTLAQNTGVVLGDFDLNPGSVATMATEKVSKDGYIGLNTELTGKGTRDQINAFLNGLDASAPLIMVNNLSIGQSGEDDMVPIQFEITMYYMPLSDPKVDTARPLPEMTNELVKVQDELANYTPISATTAAIPAVIDENREDIFKF